MRVIGLAVRDLVRAPDLDPVGRPYWTARVVNGGDSVSVNRRSGSWQTDDGREVLPFVAAMLQSDVRKIERAEARAATPPEAA